MKGSAETRVPRTTENGFTLFEIILLILLIAIVALVVALPSMLRATRSANERNASASLKSMLSNQATWKAADSDQNGVQDYWTADIAGMFYISPSAAMKTVTPQVGDVALVGMAAIGLQEVDATLARADGIVAVDYTPFAHTSSPKAGFWFCALRDYQTGNDATSATTTGYGVRNTDKFGFAAFPVAYGAGGRQGFILSENGTIWRRDVLSTAAVWTAAPVAGIGNPAGKVTDTYNTFPVQPTATNANATTAGPWTPLD